MDKTPTTEAKKQLYEYQVKFNYNKYLQVEETTQNQSKIHQTYNTTTNQNKVVKHLHNSPAAIQVIPATLEANYLNIKINSKLKKVLNLKVKILSFKGRQYFKQLIKSPKNLNYLTFTIQEFNQKY